MSLLEQEHRATTAERDALLASLEAARCETEKYRGKGSLCLSCRLFCPGQLNLMGWVQLSANRPRHRAAEEASTVDHLCRSASSHCTAEIANAAYQNVQSILLFQ